MALGGILKISDQVSGGALSLARTESQHLARALRFQLDRFHRRKEYRGSGFEIQNHSTVVQKLNTDGFAIIKDGMDKNLLLSIKRELEEHINSATCLDRPSKDLARLRGDLSGPTKFLTDEELAEGQEFYRHHTNNVQIMSPLATCPSVLEVAFDDLLLDIASSYLGCFPAIGSLNLRKSFANRLPDFDTNYFHSDENSLKFLKFFFYLNDVDEGAGPFCYVRGSHRTKFRGWKTKYRWTLEEMIAIYGDRNIVSLTANVGDLIVADTTGFHRGMKVRSSDRSMLTVNYTIHPEFQGKNPPFKIHDTHYKRLSMKQKAAADFLEVVKDEAVHELNPARPLQSHLQIDSGSD